MNSSSFEQLLKHFEDKIQTIHQLIPLAKVFNHSNNVRNEWSRNPCLTQAIRLNNDFDSNCFSAQEMRPDIRSLSEISSMTIEMKEMVEDMKQMLRQQTQVLIAQNIKCENDLNSIEKHCQHIHKNIPTFLQKTSEQKQIKTNDRNDNHLVKKVTNNGKNQVNDNSVKPVQKHVVKANKPTNTGSSKTNTAKALNNNQSIKTGNKNDNKTPPIVSFLTTEEYASIPSYILCRLSYEVINRAIGDLNRTIIAKYKLMSNYSLKYSDEQMRRYTVFKEQENRETDGQFFCTISDLKELSDLKVDNTIRKILTCLRHCKRIKEIRGNPPKLIRYAIVSDSPHSQFQ